MKLITMLALLSATCAADIVPIVQWDVEVGRLEPVPYSLTIRRGENVNLEPRFVNYNAPIDLTGAAVQLRFWYTGQTGYYATTGNVMAATGRVHIAWSDALCPASNALNYEVRATLGTNVLARGYGPLKLLAGSGGTQTNSIIYDEINWGTIDQLGGTVVLSNQIGSGLAWVNGMVVSTAPTGTAADVQINLDAHETNLTAHPYLASTQAVHTAITNHDASLTAHPTLASVPYVTGYVGTALSPYAAGTSTWWGVTNKADASNLTGFVTAPATWNSDDKTIDITMPDGTVGQMFEEVYVVIRNNTGATITNGQAVRAMSANGYYSGVALASCTDTLDQALSVIGLATQDITNNATGKITLIGNVNGIDTSGFVEGSNLWLSATAGALTMTKPTGAGERQVLIGTCLRSNANVGKIGVHVQMVPLPSDIGAATANDVTNVLDLAVSPSLTNTVRLASGAVQSNITYIGLGENSIADGPARGCFAFGKDSRTSGFISSFAIGDGCISEESGTISMGRNAWSGNKNYAFVWSGTSGGYYANASESFNINPLNGAYGFYIGANSLGAMLEMYLPTNGSGANLTGITAAQVGASPTNNFLGVVNGLSVRDPVLTLAVDGDGPYATVTPSPAGQIEYWFGNAIVQYGTQAIVRLTAGTTNVPALNYICALSTGVITNYTEYPYRTGSGETPRAIMFEVFLMDTNSIAGGSGYAMRSWTDNVEDRKGLGRISWIGERVRRLPALWESGCQVTLSATNATDDSYVLTSSGVGWQMHSHTIPAITNRMYHWILNRPDGFRAITNLQDIVIDARGNSVLTANGDCFAVNVFGFVESGITPKKTRIMLSLSSDDYSGATPAATKLANCIADSSAYDQTGVPVWMQGMTIRLARIVIRRDSATTRTYWVYDRRGQPLGTAGGGSSASGESDPVYEADLANGVLVTNVASSGGVTNGGATVNGLSISNGAAITISGGGSNTNAIWITPISTVAPSAVVSSVVQYVINHRMYWVYHDGVNISTNYMELK